MDRVQMILHKALVFEDIAPIPTEVEKSKS